MKARTASKDVFYYLAASALIQFVFKSLVNQARLTDPAHDAMDSLIFREVAGVGVAEEIRLNLSLG